MAIERLYTIPLRREALKAPRYKRTKKAVSVTRIFIQKHMKCQDVRIGKYLNLELWKHGRKNPPSKIQVKAIKDTVKIKDKEVEVVHVELPNAPVEKIEEIKKDKKLKIPPTTKEKQIVESSEDIEKKKVLEHPDPKSKEIPGSKQLPPKEQDKLQKTKKVIADPKKRSKR